MPLWTDFYAGVDREAIWNALFVHFKTRLTGFTTLSRQHTPPPALSAGSQPAFFLVQVGERRTGDKRGVVNTLKLEGFIILYVPGAGTRVAPGTETKLTATALNGFLKQIDDALVPDNRTTCKFTLGGLVTECAIEGKVDQDPGIFTPQGAAILPIYLLVP